MHHHQNVIDTRLHGRSRRFAWLAAAVAALAFVFVDACARVRTIDTVSASAPRAVPPLYADSASPSGYAGNQHFRVVPQTGIDGYHWTMQAQRMVSDGAARVRAVDYDGPAGGRAVHWSSLPHWWLAALGAVAAGVRGESPSQAIEFVFPWASALWIVVVVLVAALVARRGFGDFAASFIALGCVTAYPFYEFFTAGYYDHHGLAAAAALFAVLSLAVGAVAHRRENPPDRPDGVVRRWFIASAIIGAVGMWISASTQVVVLVAVGVAAVIAAFLPRRDNEVPALDPALWRTWGVIGGAASLLFYFIEYAPSHFALRLEVNHPVYALAWVAGGDLLARITGGLARGAPRTGANAGRGGGRGALIATDIAVLLAVPVLMLAVPDSFAIRPGTLLADIHQQFIIEFQGLGDVLRTRSWGQIVRGIGFVPIAGAALALGVISARTASVTARLAVTVCAVPAIVFTLLSFWQVRWLGVGTGLWLAACLPALSIFDAATAPARTRVALIVGAVIAVVCLGALRSSLGDVVPGEGPASYVPIVAAATIGVMVVRGAATGWTMLSRAALGAALALVLVPFPAGSVAGWRTSGWRQPTRESDVHQVIVRDVARMLRERLGDDPGVVVSGPTSSTLLTYFGGMRSIGTYYWENAAGLETVVRMLGATAASPTSTAGDSAYAMVRRNSVTHLVFFSWEPVAGEYAALAARHAAAPAAQLSAEDGFASQLLAGRDVPTWLRIVPYALAPIPALSDQWVRVYEVVPRQAPAEARVRFGLYYLALGETAGAASEFGRALALDSTFLPARVNLARMQYNDTLYGSFTESVNHIRRRASAIPGLAFEDALNAALVFLLADDRDAARTVVEAIVPRADERTLRRLPPDHSLPNLIRMLVQLDIARTQPALVTRAFRLLPPNQQQSLGAELSAAGLIVPSTVGR